MTIILTLWILLEVWASPQDNYLFTSRKNMKLHGRIEKGVKPLAEDGNFYQIFCRFSTDPMRKPRLLDTTIIRDEFEQDLAPSLMEDEELWFDPLEDHCP